MFGSHDFSVAKYIQVICHFSQLYANMCARFWFSCHSLYIFDQFECACLLIMFISHKRFRKHSWFYFDDGFTKTSPYNDNYSEDTALGISEMIGFVSRTNRWNLQMLQNRSFECE